MSLIIRPMIPELSVEALRFMDGMRVLIDANSSRAKLWHGNKPWDGNKWAVATGGEFGEACNIQKKINRVMDGLKSARDPDYETLVMQLGYEMADTVIYMFLWAAEMKIDLPAFIVDKFNIVSDREGFDIKI